jgi:hypothetical protein
MSLSGIMAACVGSDGSAERSGLSFKDLGIDGASGGIKAHPPTSRLGNIVQVGQG